MKTNVAQGIRSKNFFTSTFVFIENSRQMIGFADGAIQRFPFFLLKTPISDIH
jgi:hypothetical protein